MEASNLFTPAINSGMSFNNAPDGQQNSAMSFNNAPDGQHNSGISFNNAPDGHQRGPAPDFHPNVFVESGQLDAANFPLETNPPDNYDWSHVYFANNAGFPENEVAGELDSLAVQSIFSTPPLDSVSQATPDTTTSHSNMSVNARITAPTHENEMRTGFNGASAATDNRQISAQYSQPTLLLKQLPHHEQQQPHGVVMTPRMPPNPPTSTPVATNSQPVYAMHCSPGQTCFAWPPKKGPDGQMEDEHVMAQLMPKPSQEQMRQMQQPRPDMPLPPELQKHVIPFVPNKHPSAAVQRRHSSAGHFFLPPAQQPQQNQGPQASPNLHYYQSQNQQQPPPSLSYPKPYSQPYSQQNQQSGCVQFPSPSFPPNGQQLSHQQFPSYPQQFRQTQNMAGFQQAQNAHNIQQRQNMQPSAGDKVRCQPGQPQTGQPQPSQPQPTQPPAASLQGNNWPPIQHPHDLFRDSAPYFTAKGHESQRKEKPSSGATRPWDGSPNHCGTTWNVEQIYPDLMSNSSANHIKPVAKCDILMGQSSQRAVQEAIQAGFFRGAEWLFRLTVEHMNKELRQHNTMLGFPPRKKDSKIDEIKKALVDQIIRNNPPMVAAAMSAQAIGWSFDQYYPGVFFKEDANGTVRDGDAILEAWKKLREDVVPSQLQPVLYEMSTGLMVQTDKQPAQPPVADVCKVTKPPVTTEKAREPKIKMAQFPPNGNGNLATGSSTMAAGGESFFTQPEGPSSMAKVMQKQREQREECDKSRTTTETQLQEKTIAEKKRGERQWKKSEKQGWMLTGRKKETWFGGNKTVLWECVDGEFRDLTDEVFKSVMERTRQNGNRQRAKTAAAAAAGLATTEAEGATMSHTQAMEMGQSFGSQTEEKADEDQGGQNRVENGGGGGEEEMFNVMAKAGGAHDGVESEAVDGVESQNMDLSAEMEMFDFGSFLQSDFSLSETPSVMERSGSGSDNAEKTKKRRMADNESSCGGRKRVRSGQGSGLRQPGMGEQMLYAPPETSF